MQNFTLSPFLYDKKGLHKFFLVMRLTTLGILLCIMQVSAATFAQRITLKAKNISYEKLFKTIEQQSGYTFVYDPDVLRTFPSFNIEINDANITEVMEKLLANKPLNYKVIDNTIVVRLKETTAQRSELIFISGKVTGQNGFALPGVTVKVKGSTVITGWVTNAEGRFNALVNSKNVVLVFSYVGYQTQEMRIEDLKSPFTIQLKEDISKLDEIQVIAYGQTTKRLNVGDQTTVTAKEIEKYPVGNVLSVLQGTVPGMVISQSTGQAGSTYNVVIRGQNGLTTSSAPLYVIDGIPYNGGGYSSQKSNFLGSNNQAYDALSLINPLDIESINVLKDADATSIYGSRGANGVILITTKKGKAGNTRIDVNVFSGISQAIATPQLLNTQQYLQMRNEAKKNDNAAILPTDYDINGTWDTTRYTDWSKMFLKGTGYNTNAQASISGGGNNVSYLVSGNFRRSTNVQQLIGGSDQTSSLHFSLNSTSNNNKFNMQFTGGYTYDFNNIPSVDLTSNANLAPDAPVLYNADGSLNFQNNTFGNPLLSAKALARTSLSNLTSSMVASYLLAKGLKVQATVGYNKQSLNEFLATPLASVLPTLVALGVKGSANYSWNNKSFWSIEPQLEYNRSISKGTLDVLIGGSIQKQMVDATQLQALGYSNDLLINNIAAGSSIVALGQGYNAYNYKYSALYGRANYNWEGKYIVDLSGRYDGSSKFGQSRQFHFFYATGAGWVFSSENFIKNAIPFLSFGKIKGSYGTSGNDQIGTYLYLENFSAVSSTNAYQGVPGIIPTNLPNPYLSWESTAKANIGIELQFLKGRIGLQGNFFRNRTTDVLSSVPLSSTTGFTAINQNIDAKVQNKGFDITLSTTNIQSGSFVWTTSFMISRQRNKLLAFPNATGLAQQQISQSVGTFFVNRYAGVDPQTGLYQFYDKDGKIVSAPSSSGSDQTKMINTDPGYFGSVSNTISFKGFSLSFLFRGIKQTGRSPFGQILSTSFLPGLPNTNYPTAILDHWQKPGDVAKFGKPGSTFGTTLFNALNARSMFLDAYYSDASYIRLQNASLSYQFDNEVARKCHLRSLKVYALGENLATISGYNFSDPETQSYLKMSPLRTITFGIQASL
jgi:TonB-linked SusC/RagA family outer membrane protein